MYVKWAPYHHDMVRPRIPDEADGLQVLVVSAYILNKQSRSPDKGSYCSLWVGR